MGQVGGKRPGAGRPLGSKNKRTSAVRERLEELGADPIQVLHDLMKTGGADGDEKIQLDAAKALLPYAYPRLSTQDINLAAEFMPDVTLRLIMPDDDSDD